MLIAKLNVGLDSSRLEPSSASRLRNERLARFLVVRAGWPERFQRMWRISNRC